MANFTVVIEKDEDGFFIASVPALPGCHTQAKTKEELKSRIKEAIELHLESGEKADYDAQFVEVQNIEVKVDDNLTSAKA
jgi:predicted RNase H-like HicB family nuclease